MGSSIAWTQKERRKIIDGLTAQGGEPREANHVTLFKMPNGVSIGIPYTPSDYRTRANTRAEVRRAGYDWPLDSPRGKRQTEEATDRLKTDLATIPRPLTLSGIQAWRRANNRAEGNATSIRRALLDLGYVEDGKTANGGQVWVPAEGPDVYIRTDHDTLTIREKTAFGTVTSEFDRDVVQAVLDEEDQESAAEAGPTVGLTPEEARAYVEERGGKLLGDGSREDPYRVEPPPPVELTLAEAHAAIETQQPDHARDAERLLEQLLAAEAERDDALNQRDHLQDLRAQAEAERDELKRHLAEVGGERARFKGLWEQVSREHEADTQALAMMDRMALDLGEAWQLVWRQARQIRELDDLAGEWKHRHDRLQAALDERDQLIAQRLGVVVPVPADDGWETFMPRDVRVSVNELYRAASLLGYDIRIQRQPAPPF